MKVYYTPNELNKKQKLIAFTMPLLVLLLGVVILCNYISLSNKCTTEVQATVVQVLEDTNYSTTNGTTRTERTYAPVYSLEYEGNFYEITSSTYSSSYRGKIGDKETIKINPDNPNEFIENKDGRLIISIMFIVLGSFAEIVFIYGEYSIRNSGSKSHENN